MAIDFKKALAQAAVKNETIDFIKERVALHNSTCEKGYEMTVEKLVEWIVFKLSNNK